MKKYSECESCGLELREGKERYDVLSMMSPYDQIEFVFCSTECLQAWAIWQVKTTSRNHAEWLRNNKKES